MSTTEGQTEVNSNLQKQDLSQLDITKLTALSPEVISRQATINIGTIGHVAHGKSTVVKAISGVQTVRFKNELERNITIKLERIPYDKALELTRSREKLRKFIKKLNEKQQNHNHRRILNGYNNVNHRQNDVKQKMTTTPAKAVLSSDKRKQTTMLNFFKISPKIQKICPVTDDVLKENTPNNDETMNDDHVITRDLNYSDCSDSIRSCPTTSTSYSELMNCNSPFEYVKNLSLPSSLIEFKTPKIPKKKNNTSNSNSNQSNGKEKEYIVESIEDIEEINSSPVFEVKWKNYPSSQNTWEPLENLKECNLLEPFIDSQVEKYKTTIDRIFNQILDEFKSEKQQLTLSEQEIIMKIDEGGYDHRANSVDLILLALFYLAGAKRKVRERTIRNRIKERLLFNPYFYRRKEQLQKIHAWKIRMNDKESSSIDVENYVDFDIPPESFSYITKNMANIDIQIPEDPPIGCTCIDGCSYRSDCCGKMSGSLFAYYTNKRLRLQPGYPIFECNKRCSCSLDCPNRIVQKGRKNNLCIFKTNNGCGWGVKTKKVIHEGEFISEYVGEIITVKEADRRGKIYDAEGRTYLFDLDFNDESDCVYSIDAAFNGNVSRFINHSCEPNSQIYPVWVDCLDPNLPRLALFALRRIEAGEEITFDYLNQNGRSAATTATATTTTTTIKTEEQDSTIKQQNTTTTINNDKSSEEMTSINDDKSNEKEEAKEEVRPLNDDNKINEENIVNDKSDKEIPPMPDDSSTITINSTISSTFKERMLCRCGSAKCRKYLF